MNNTKRTLEQLRNDYTGKVYIYLKDEKTLRRFYADAQTQGWRFGALRPADALPDELIALNKNRQLSHVGFVGRIAFRCGGGSSAKGRFHRIDYAKYISGDKKYRMK